MQTKNMEFLNARSIKTVMSLFGSLVVIGLFTNSRFNFYASVS